jgi:hypothetical protein
LIERAIEHGRKDISIGEVWVVCNDSISNNAKHVIASSFRGLSIEIFDVEDLVTRVDKHAAFLWEDVPSALGHYLVDLDLRLAAEDEKARLLGGVISTPNIELEFAPLEMGEFKRSRRKRRDLIRLNDEIDARSLIVVQGEMGSGKSHLLRHLGRQFSSLELLATRRLVPVHTSYRKLVDEFDGSIGECIEKTIGPAAADIDPKVHQILPLVDGIDEVQTDDESDDAIEQIASQIRDRPNTKVIVTTRPRTLSKEKDLTISNVRRVEIRPLTIGKIIQFIKDALRNKNLPPRLVEDVNNSDLFKQLPQNPIAAQLLTRLLLEGRDELPQTMSELYGKSMELMLGRWDEQKGLASQQEYDVARRVFYRLARTAMLGRTDVFGRSEVSTELDLYLKERNLVVDKKLVEARIFERSGVMYSDDAAGKIGFRHRSFAEYLFAESFKDQSDLGKEPHPYSQFWANTYFFWIGIKRDCESELQRILTTPCASEDERLGRMFCLPEYLMAGHMTPYAVTRNAVGKLLLEAAEMYFDVLNGRMKTPLAVFSPMRLLWIFTTIIRHRYGYGFFLPALEDAATDICGSIAAPEARAAAMFFAAITASDLDKPAAFDLMLGEFKKELLPLPISLAIEAETGQLDKQRVTTAVKAFGKRMKRSLKASALSKRKIDQLYSEPISPEMVEELRGQRRGVSAPKSS